MSASRRAHLAAIRPDADPAEADWWDTTWGEGTPAAVGFLIPRGFEAYARVLHPVRDSHGRDVGWSTVAEHCGTTLHPEAQWHRVAGGRDLDPRGRGPEPVRWTGEAPDPGVLGRAGFAALADVLGRHTGTPEDTIVAFWDGFGTWPRAWREVPTARQPGRDYFLFRRPLAEVEQLCADAPAVRWALGDQASGTVTVFLPVGAGDPAPPPTSDQLLEMWAPFEWQSPSQWWPADRSWATSNDTDLDSTLVGGTRALVDDLLADDRLEVLPWPVDGSLWSGADTIDA